MIKITVAIPVFNRKEIVVDAINSILDQKYENFELLIVDNCSTDGTYDVIKKFESEKVKVYRNETNIGMGKNFLKCIELANGEWFKFLMSDDLFFPGALNIIDQIEATDSEIEIIVTSQGAWNSIVPNKIIENKDILKSILDTKTVLKQRSKWKFGLTAMPNAFAIKTHLLKKMITEQKFNKIVSPILTSGHDLDYLILYYNICKIDKFVEIDYPTYSVRCHTMQGSKSYNKNLIYHITGDFFVFTNLYNYSFFKKLFIFPHAFKAFFNLLKNCLYDRDIIVFIIPFNFIKLLMYLGVDIIRNESIIRTK